MAEAAGRDQHLRQRERASIPALLIDRSYTAAKTLTVAGSKMRYSFELDRLGEADGVEGVAPLGGNIGLGVRRRYSYVGAFDGHSGTTRGWPQVTGSAVFANKRQTAARVFSRGG